MLPDFKNSERWQQLESGAYTGLLDMSEYPAAEYRYFDRYAALGKAYRSGEITVEEAKRRKQKLLADYREDASGQDKVNHYWRERAEAIHTSELNRVAINGEDDITAVAILACKTLAIITGDIMMARKAEKIKEETEK